MICYIKRPTVPTPTPASVTNNNNGVSFMQHVKDVPKTGPLHHRLKNAPIDQIPISKAPRRQKSSRFYVTEKVQLEPTPAFHGKKKPPLYIFIYV